MNLSHYFFFRTSFCLSSILMDFDFFPQILFSFIQLEFPSILSNPLNKNAYFHFFHICYFFLNFYFNPTSSHFHHFQFLNFLFFPNFFNQCWNPSFWSWRYWVVWCWNLLKFRDRTGYSCWKLKGCLEVNHI